MLSIDLNTLSAKNGKAYIIKNGKPVGNYQIDQRPVTFDELDQLYSDYKHSVPNGKHYKYNYFKALQEDSLPLGDLINGHNRDAAKEALEITILTGILNGSLKWPNPQNWFWQSSKDKDFVLLRTWFMKGDELNICQTPLNKLFSPTDTS